MVRPFPQTPVAGSFRPVGQTLLRGQAAAPKSRLPCPDSISSNCSGSNGAVGSGAEKGPPKTVPAVSQAALGTGWDPPEQLAYSIKSSLGGNRPMAIRRGTI
ncbi:MAG: hypothetical protein DBX61_07075 [Clostridiales bacterium]|nr:MAG: hypothetical protein DBX61_07075 [Clostridiales bacterium]